MTNASIETAVEIAIANKEQAKEARKAAKRARKVAKRVQKSLDLDDNETRTQVKHSKKKDAKARRELHEKWERMSSNPRYERAAAQEQCRKITEDIKDEVLDGIFLELDEHNNHKSTSEKKRILRRIVEKRHAQAIHKKLTHKGRFAANICKEGISRCMAAIYHQQYCIAG